LSVVPRRSKSPVSLVWLPKSLNRKSRLFNRGRTADSESQDLTGNGMGLISWRGLYPLTPRNGARPVCGYTWANDRWSTRAPPVDQIGRAPRTQAVASFRRLPPHERFHVRVLGVRPLDVIGLDWTTAFEADYEPPQSKAKVVRKSKIDGTDRWSRRIKYHGDH
jgi:hypothetical protein